MTTGVEVGEELRTWEKWARERVQVSRPTGVTRWWKLCAYRSHEAITHLSHSPIDMEGEMEEDTHLVLGSALLESCCSTSSSPSINASVRGFEPPFIFSTNLCP